MSPKKPLLIALSAIMSAALSASAMHAQAQASALKVKLSPHREWAERTFFNTYTGLFATRMAGTPNWVEHQNVGGYDTNNIYCPETWRPTLMSGEQSCTRQAGGNKFFEKSFQFYLHYPRFELLCGLKVQALATATTSAEQLAQRESQVMDFIDTATLSTVLPATSPDSFTAVRANPSADVHYFAIRIHCGNSMSTVPVADTQAALQAAGFSFSTP